jgi:rubrerythrin
MPQMKILANLFYQCPTCKHAMRYDGKSPAPDCPVCKKREEELEGVGTIGGSLSRKGKT